MQTVNVADLKSNLSAWLEQVRNGGEIVVQDRDMPIARLMPFAAGADLDAEEEEALIAAGLMRQPPDAKNDDFLDYPAPEVSPEAVRAALRSERDED